MYLTHLIFFGSLSLGLYVISKRLYISGIIASILGIVKELCDGLLHMGNCDYMDMIFNLIGITICLCIGRKVLC